MTRDGLSGERDRPGKAALAPIAASGHKATDLHDGLGDGHAGRYRIPHGPERQAIFFKIPERKEECAQEGSKRRASSPGPGSQNTGFVQIEGGIMNEGPDPHKNFCSRQADGHGEQHIGPGFHLGETLFPDQNEDDADPYEISENHEKIIG